MKTSIANVPIDRRRFNAWLAAGLAAGLYPGIAQSQQKKAQTLKVAALQMAPKLGNAQANMEQAERLIRDAQKTGAQWIMLPEMFTTAAAFHPDMLKAIQPVDGAPMQMMRRLAKQGNSVIGGSFLASRNGEVYNSFLLVWPEGHVGRHDNDQPTYWENCYDRGGEDDGVLATPVGDVGSVLCWEFIRSQTMPRLRGKIQ